jgi:hypothetical protein
MNPVPPEYGKENIESGTISVLPMTFHDHFKDIRE